ncbi:MAG: hypothetical protein DRQ55_04890 [Planctomycetota bacterium]|nr:MAG: hypothetical protein DRQ55_04890 [Planctomycetota bacterium]
MTRLFKTLAVASLAVMLVTVACATDDVSASAEGEGTLSTEAELTCCQESAMAGETECCGESIEGQYCPVTGTKLED